MPSLNTKHQIVSSLSPISSDFKHVNIKIDHEVILKIAEMIHHTSINNWQSKYIFNNGSEKALNYFAIFAALSFCYWQEPKWHIWVDGETIGGSYGLFFSLKKAIVSGKDITNVDYIEDLKFEEFKEILEGSDSTVIPLLQERYLILKEIGTVLKRRFGGSFKNLFEEAEYDANKINNLLVLNFDCYKDEFDYDGSKLKFYRKSQEVITLVYEAFGGKSFGEIKNIDCLTSSSDYKLPQILNYLEILQYSNDLENKIQNKTEFKMEDREALEIRTATIVAIEEIIKMIKSLGLDITAVELSNILWTATQNEDFKTKALPYPRIWSVWV